MRKYTIAELARALQSRDTSALELTERYLKAIKEKNERINAYITVCEDSALKSARRVDERRRDGKKLGALAGIPFAVKDNFCTAGIYTTCGSKMLEYYVPPYTATAVERLCDQGAVLLGKLNMDEFAMGSASDTSIFGAVKNPLDTARTAGGSSGGSAAAVVSDMAVFALGSDTGGSVRQPAAFCGCIGLKPTRGAISRYGLVAFASSLDTVGILAGCADDARIVFEVVRGRDSFDATSVDLPQIQACSVENMTVGICEDTLKKATSEVADGILAAAEKLKQSGVRIKSVKLPDTDTYLAAYYVISSAEASSNLGRYDGVRYGHRAVGVASVNELFENSRTEGFGDEVKRRIMLGTYCLYGEGRREYYSRAQAAREKISAELCTQLSECNAILLPTSPTVAYRFSEKKPTPLEVYREDAFCVLANLAEFPALNVPYGLCDGMPVGVQLIGRKFEESTLLDIARLLEK